MYWKKKKTSYCNTDKITNEHKNFIDNIGSFSLENYKEL